MQSMSTRFAAIASTVTVLAVGAPVAGASAATGSTPAGTVPVNPLPAGSWPAPKLAPGLKFTPPSVGPIAVNLGAIIIDGKMISPGLHVSTPGVTVPFGAGG